MYVGGGKAVLAHELGDRRSLRRADLEHQGAAVRQPIECVDCDGFVCLETARPGASLASKSAMMRPRSSSRWRSGGKEKVNPETRALRSGRSWIR